MGRGDRPGLKLRVTHPAIGEITVPIEPRGLLVGREGGRADLDMNWDRKVSRRHVRFWIEDGIVWFEDVGSKNGVWEGDQRVDGRHRLLEGVWITVGETIFSVAREGTNHPSGGLAGIDTLDLDSLCFEDSVTVDASSPSPRRAAPPLDIPASFDDLAPPPPGAAPPPPPAPPRSVPLGGGFTSLSAGFASLSEDPATLAGAPGLLSAPIGAPSPAPMSNPLGAPALEGGPATLAPPPGPPQSFAGAATLPPPGASDSFGSNTSSHIAMLTAPPQYWPSLVSPPPPPTQKPPSDRDKVLRIHPRFLTEKKVTMRIGEREELRTLWTENISKGGLFVKTEQPPPRGARVEVAIQTPAGELALAAEVVHVLDAVTAQQVGQTPGVGLQFVDLTTDQRDAVFRYVDGLAERISGAMPVEGAPAPPVNVQASIERTLARAREFISLVEKNDLYAALTVKPTASDNEIMTRISELRRLFTAVEGPATPPQLARLNASKKLLDRTESLMGSVERRLEYDFRRGEVRVEDRIAAAKAKRGPPMTELRGIWHVALPNRLEKAAELIRRAFEAKKKRDIVEALRLGQQALELDPFHEELRQTVNAWQTMAKPGGS